MDREFGRLKKLDNLRTFWENEPKNFTEWLAQDENILLLSETIGIELEVQSQEEGVGPFSADILCKNTIDSSYVLIENQLEKTDHTHLGQLMTYAAGLDAVTIIWIAKKFTDEHRATLDWLNKITDDQFAFFGIEIVVYKIGDSAPAPTFNIVSKPNDWTKQVKKSSSTQKLSDITLLQQEYWRGLKSFMEKSKSKIKMQTPAPQHWTTISIGKSDFTLSCSVNSKDKSISVSLNIYGEQAKENYEKLYKLANSDSLIKISNDLTWDKMEDKKMSSVSLKIKSDFTDKNEWQGQFKWFKDNLENFTNYFKPKLKNLL
jgi:hypothetical protein